MNNIMVNYHWRYLFTFFVIHCYITIKIVYVYNLNVMIIDSEIPENIVTTIRNKPYFSVCIPQPIYLLMC